MGIMPANGGAIYSPSAELPLASPIAARARAHTMLRSVGTFRSRCTLRAVQQPCQADGAFEIPRARVNVCHVAIAPLHPGAKLSAGCGRKGESISMRMQDSGMPRDASVIRGPSPLCVAA